MTVLTIFILAAGCNRSKAARSSADSVKIKALEQMQLRGVAYRKVSDFQKAIEVHDSCIAMAVKISDTIQLVIALNNQGTNFRRLGALKDASDYHFRALAICDAYKDKTSHEANKNRAHSLNGLGNVFLSIGNNDAAEEAFRKAMKVENDLGSATGQAINLANIGFIKKAEGDFDSARIYYNRSMEKNREDKNMLGVSLCYTYLGELDELSGDINKANENFQHSYSLGQITHDTWHWLVPCISLAQNFLTINRLDSAEKYISIGIKAAHDIGSNEHLATLYGMRSLLKDKQGKTEPALRDLRQSRIYTDSLITEEAKNSIQNSRVKYEVNRLNKHVKAAEDKAAKKALLLQLVIIGTILIVILVTTWWILVNRTIKTRRKITAERELFYRNVTHQLRTPMVVVLGMIHRLSSHINADDKTGQEELSAAKRQSVQLLDLIKQLIAASKTGEYVKLGDIGDIRSLNSVPDDDLIDSKNKFSSVNTQSVSAPLRRWSILLAEDNEDVALLICGILRDNGYDVTHAVDGREALEILADGLPDLIITDIAMPRMDGLQLMRAIRADVTMSHLPILVVSARVENSERMEGVEAGAEVYLEKPFMNEELLLRVKTILEQRERIRQSFISNATNVDDTTDNCQGDEECEFLHNLNTLISEHMRSGDVNSTFISEHLFMSVSTLNRKIKSLTGLPSAVYIRNRRLIEAKRLLAETNMPIGEIETLCGFNTPGHMSRLFRTEMGCSPSEYRGRHNIT